MHQNGRGDIATAKVVISEVLTLDASRLGIAGALRVVFAFDLGGRPGLRGPVLRTELVALDPGSSFSKVPYSLRSRLLSD